MLRMAELNKESAIAGAIAVIVVPAYFVVGYVVEALCIVLLWRWYAVPVFHLPPLSIPQAIGLSTITTLMSFRTVPPKEVDNWAYFRLVFVAPLLCLLVGWIARFWL